MKLSCGAKTFILGEYLVLKGHPALIAATRPRFELVANFQSTSASPFHPESPAGKLFEESRGILGPVALEFRHPTGRGGWGASSAEFLLLHCLVQIKRGLAPESHWAPDLSLLLEDYKKFASQGGVAPSGADVLAQASGLISRVDRGRGHISQTEWPFQEIGFLLASTGMKVPTHEHLRALGEWNESSLLEAVQKGLSAFADRYPEGFIEAVRQTRHELQSRGFEAPSTQKFLRPFEADPRVLAMKGCGALGADVVLFVCATSDMSNLAHDLSRQGAPDVFSSADLTGGVETRA